MNEEMRTEAMELCVTACEKFASNNEVSTPIETSITPDQTFDSTMILHVHVILTSIHVLEAHIGFFTVLVNQLY